MDNVLLTIYCPMMRWIFIYIISFKIMSFVVSTMTSHSDLYSCGTISWMLRRINNKAIYIEKNGRQLINIKSD